MPQIPDGMKHERVVIRQDPDTGLRFIVAVHSTVLGPALGGMRLKAYPGDISEALEDVLGLARTMSLKASAAGLDLGGGKAVMLDDGDTSRRADRMVAAAKVVDELGGAYITAEDIGTTTDDMDLMSRHTRFVVGRSQGNGGRGDPSPITAETVVRAMGRGLAAATGSGSFDGRTVGVLGLGKVGSALAEKLAAAGTRVLAYEINEERLERHASEGTVEPVASTEDMLGRELDVLAPCAAGGLIGPDTPLSCRVVCGAANNPLTSPAAAESLAARGILYVPDFLANCGGLISVAAEWYRSDDVEAHIATAMERLDAALAESLAKGETPAAVAERHALERIERARNSRARLVAAA